VFSNSETDEKYRLSYHPNMQGKIFIVSTIFYHPKILLNNIPDILETLMTLKNQAPQLQSY